VPIDHLGLGVPDATPRSRTAFLDVHGFMLEVVTYERVDDADA
jgi:hypothetical protein